VDVAMRKKRYGREVRRFFGKNANTKNYALPE
jgi:hypothetical protein